MKRKFEVIGAPFGFAANQSGSSQGPSHLRQNGLKTKINQRIKRWNEDIVDSGDVLIESEIQELLEHNEILKAVELYCNKLISRIYQSYTAQRTPIILGGDHTISIASITAAASFLKQELQKDKLGVIWVDAHADLSDWKHGNIHGKAAAILLGLGPHADLIHIQDFSPKILPQNIIYIGLNDLMPNEYETIKALGIQVYGMEDVEAQGIHSIINEAVTQLEETTDALFLSFDVDACDGAIYRGCAVPEIGGLTGREAIHLVHRVAQSSKFIGTDIVEFSPEDDMFKNTNQLIIRMFDAILGYRM